MFNLLSCLGQRSAVHFSIQSVERGDETLAQSPPSLSPASLQTCDRAQGGVSVWSHHVEEARWCVCVRYMQFTGMFE